MEIAISSSTAICSRQSIPKQHSSKSQLSLSSSKSYFFSKSNLLTLKSNRAISSRTSVSLIRPNKGAFSCTCLFGLGVPELVVIASVAALLFGPKQLPEVGRSIGKTVKSFQQAAKEFESELKKEPESGAELSAAVNDEQKEDENVTNTKANSSL